MKNVKHLLVITLTVLVFFSCNKEREEEPDRSYTNADDFYDENKEEEQEFIIESDEGDCIIAKQGTIICGDRSFLATASNGTVELPYVIKVLELYSIKDHILHNFPTTATGEALKNGGSVRIKTFKNDQEASLTTAGGFNATYSVDPAKAGNSVLKGTMTGDTFSDWEYTSDGSTLTTPTTRDFLSLGSFGWFQTAQSSYATPTTVVTFQLDGSGAEALDLWLVHSDNNTLLHGTDLKIENVPTDEKFTAIVIAVDQDNQLVLHQSTFTVSPNQQVEIEFEEISENALLDKLEDL